MTLDSMRAILRSAAWLLVIQVVCGALQFVTIALLARELGPGSYGHWAFALALVNFVAVFADLGLSTLSLRDLAREPGQTAAYVAAAAWMKLGSSLLLLAGLVASGMLLSRDAESRTLVMLLGAQMVFASGLLYLLSVLRVQGLTHLEAAARIAQALLLLIAVLVLSVLDSSAVLIACSYLGTTAGVFAVTAALISSRFEVRLRFDRRLMARLAGEGWPIVLAMFVANIYLYFDSVYMGLLGQDIQVGWYAAAYAPILWILGLVMVLRGAFMPEQSRQLREPDQASWFLRFYGSISLALALPVAVGGFIVSREFIELVYGNSFLPATRAMGLLCITAGLMFLSNFFGSIMLVQGRQRTYMLGVCTAAAVNVVLNLVLIPRYSLNAAAAITLLSEATIVVFTWWQCRRLVDIGALWLFSRTPLIAAAALAAVLLPTTGVVPLPVSLVIGAGTYVVACYLLGFFAQLLPDQSEHAWHGVLPGPHAGPSSP